MRLELVPTLCDLIRLPSVNPMGREVAGDPYFEWRVTDYLESVFLELGVPYARQHVSPLRENIVARIDGTRPLEQGGKLLLLEAHQDTVPVDGMTIPPFTPDVRGGRVYGRGSCDIKGALACLLVLMQRLLEERSTEMPTVAFAFPVNEEHGFSGARAIAATWKADAPASPLRTLLPRAPDAAVICEPTLLNVVVAHKGVVRWRCHTHGQAGHSSRPEGAENAIYRMASVLSALERYAGEVAPTLFEHPLVGRPTLSVGTIQGGISVNTVPDHCTIEIDRRVLPLDADEPRAAQRHVIDYLQRALPANVRLRHEEPYIQSRGLSDQANGDLLAKLASAAQSCGAPGEKIGVPYGTDAPAYASLGIPSVVFGPGSIAQAHTSDEWVAIDQLEAAVEILHRFARSFGE